MPYTPSRFPVRGLITYGAADSGGGDPDGGGGGGTPVDRTLQYLRVTGVQDVMASTPDKSAFDVVSTGSFTICVRLALDSWASGATQRIAAFYDAQATSTWRLSVLSTGLVEMAIVGSGGTQSTGATTTSITTVATAGQALWLRATVNSGTGQAYFYTAADSLTLPTSWTTLQLNRGAFTFPINNGSANFYVGSALGSTVPATGNFYHAVLTTGIDPNTGTVLAEFNAADWTTGTSWTSTTTGEVWTLLNGATIGNTGGGGGGGGGGAVAGVPPPMPTTAKDGTWQLTHSTDFDVNAAEGTILSATGYGAAAGTTNVGTMKLDAYTYSATHMSGYNDTSSKQTRTITITMTKGSTTITSSGAFTSANYVYEGNPTGQYGGSYIESSGNLTNGTRISVVQDTSTAFMTLPALTSITTTVTCRSDYGKYDQNRYSVANGICTLRISTDTAGRHHVGALRPKLSPTFPYGVLGGRFTQCMRVPTALNTIKVAHELWPDSNVSNPDGEIDCPEQNLYGGDTVGAFTHWQGGGGQYAGPTSPLSIVGTEWVTVVIEWRPNPGTPTLSTVKYYAAKQDSTGAIVAGSLTVPFNSQSGVKIPNTKMHWVLQTECDLTYTRAKDDTASGTLETAWITYEKMI